MDYFIPRNLALTELKTKITSNTIDGPCTLYRPGTNITCIIKKREHFILSMSRTKHSPIIPP